MFTLLEDLPPDALDQRNTLLSVLSELGLEEMLQLLNGILQESYYRGKYSGTIVANIPIEDFKELKRKYNI